jgi:hypothetical protein
MTVGCWDYPPFMTSCGDEIWFVERVTEPVVIPLPEVTPYCVQYPNEGFERAARIVECLHPNSIFFLQ